MGYLLLFKQWRRCQTMLHKSGAKKRRRTRSEWKVYDKSQTGQTHNGQRIISFCRKLFFLNYRITCRMPWHSSADAMVRLPSNWRMRSVHTLWIGLPKKELAQSLRNVLCPLLSGGGQFAPFLWGQSAFCGKYFSLHIIEITIGAAGYWLVLAAFNCFHLCKSVRRSGRQSESAQINNCHICSLKSIGWLLFVCFFSRSFGGLCFGETVRNRMRAISIVFCPLLCGFFSAHANNVVVVGGYAISLCVCKRRRNRFFLSAVFHLFHRLGGNPIYIYHLAMYSRNVTFALRIKTLNVLECMVWMLRRA